MTSVDDLFRKPKAIPKRKLEDPTSTFSRSSNKSAKRANGTSPHTSKPPAERTSGSRAASVQDEVPEEQSTSAAAAEDDDLEAGPAPPPDEEEIEEDIADDDEGRFFGGGTTKQERDVMDYVDRQDDNQEEEKYDSVWLTKTLKSFDKKVKVNTELRTKYADDPMKFVGSEADLDAEIKGLSLLGENGELYSSFAKSSSAESLVQLLAHENTDIAISVVQLLEELTDQDVSATSEQWKVLVDILIEQDLIALLVSNLGRLEEDKNNNDRDGVYHILGVMENVLSAPANVDRVASNEVLTRWLLDRIKKPDADARNQVGQNRQYAAEVLAILLQGSNTHRERVAKDNGAEDFLVLLHHYRSRDPDRDSDEEEFVENVFDSLTCLVEAATGAEEFLKAEGIELCLLMLKDGKLSKPRSLKVLDHAMAGDGATEICDKVVQEGGLKTMFSMLMKSKNRGEREEIHHLIGMLSSLLRYTPANSAARIRTLAKFVEKDYEKISRLTELRKEYQARLDRLEAEISTEKRQVEDDELAEQEDEWLSRRLDAGLSTLQTLDVVLSWLVAEDAGARSRIISLLQGQNGLKVLSTSLKRQQVGMDETTSKAREAKEMLQALLGCLQ